MTNLLQLDAIGRSNPRAARLRKRWKRKYQVAPAVLGKGDGNDPYYGAGNNRIWVRRDGGSTDDEGNIQQMLPEKVYCGAGDYYAYDGARVWLETDPQGQWQVKQADNQNSEAAGLHTGQLNNGNPANKWLRLKNATRLKALPVGTAANPSTLVGIRGLLYDDNYGDFNRFTATGTAANKFDLSTYIPGAGLHAVVVVWLDTVNNVIVATSSTSQSTATDLDETDYQEAFDARVAEAVPIQAFHLGNAQTSVDQRNLGEDVRQFINMPQAIGFANPVDKDAIIRSGRTQRVCDDLSVTANLTINGTLTAESVTVSLTGGVTIGASGGLTIQSCDVAAIGDAITSITPILIEIDDTNSPYTATTESLDIKIIADTSAGNITVNLPTITGNKNQRYSIKNTGTGTVTIDANASETIDGQLEWEVPQYGSPRLVATSVEWSII